MSPAPRTPDRPASLEALVECGMVDLESLHPGGLELTAELAELCGIHDGSRVLDVASGTGESACFLAERLGAEVYGIDVSHDLLARARDKARAKELSAVFVHGDAARLPFDDARFDAAMCECTLCLLDKACVLAEMRRVVRPGGWIGMHDLYWTPAAPEAVQRTLAEIEGERPETLVGWREAFVRAGLPEPRILDRTAELRRWMRASRRRLGLAGQLALTRRIASRWGVRGLWRVLRSERVFAGRHLGYAVVVAARP